MGAFSTFAEQIGKTIKKLNLFKKTLRKKTMILSFVLKSYPFIKENKRDEHCNMIDAYCKSLNGNYLKLNKYFNKYWRKYELFNFTKLDNDKIKISTNNVIGSFHRKLNHEIEHYHPKTSFLIEELKRITKSYYKEYINNLSEICKSENEINYLADDIVNFIKNFITINKENFHIDSLVQYLNKDTNNFTNLMISILKIVGDFKDDIYDDIKNIFIDKNIIEENENRSEDSGDENGEENQYNVENEKHETNIKKGKSDKLPGYEAYLIKGDVLLEENIKPKKIRKKLV